MDNNFSRVGYGICCRYSISIGVSKRARRQQVMLADVARRPFHLINDDDKEILKEHSASRQRHEGINPGRDTTGKFRPQGFAIRTTVLGGHSLAAHFTFSATAGYAKESQFSQQQRGSILQECCLIVNR
jgi:hypothetical protein